MDHYTHRTDNEMSYNVWYATWFYSSLPYQRKNKEAASDVIYALSETFALNCSVDDPH